MSVTLDCTIGLFVRCGKDSNFVMAVATQVARNANEVMVEPMVESALDGSWRQEVCFALVRLAGIWLQSP
jgi:hypothetical protein